MAHFNAVSVPEPEGQNNESKTSMKRMFVSAVYTCSSVAPVQTRLQCDGESSIGVSFQTKKPMLYNGYEIFKTIVGSTNSGAREPFQPDAPVLEATGPDRNFIYPSKYTSIHSWT